METDDKNKDNSDAADTSATQKGRKSTRQKDKDQVKEREEIDKIMDGPVENIDWEKVTPDDRVKMKNKFVEDEKKMTEAVCKLQSCSAIYPIGRDRVFQRYWVFRTMPGVFVENHDDFVPDDSLVHVPQINTKSDTQHKDEKGTGSDKENESFDGKTHGNINGEITIKSSENEEKMQVDEDDKLSVATESIQDLIARKSKIQWGFYNTEQEIDMLIESLNARGFREGPLKLALLEHKKTIFEQLPSCPVNSLVITKEEADSAREKIVRYQSIKAGNRTTHGAVDNNSAQELMELNLREMLLDIEERIHVGTLGHLKVCLL